MALSARITTLIANLARRGDAFARNVLYKATDRDQLLISSLAKRGDYLAQRHVKGTSASVNAKAVVNHLAAAGDGIAQGVNSVTTDKLAQVITFAALDPVELVDAETPAVGTLVATSDSGLPVTFRVVSGPATLAGNVLTITDEGNVVISAEQAGNANYAAATPVERTIVVTIAV
jgi:hypothetical protein